MAKKTSENKTGVAEKVTAAEVETTAAVQAASATESGNEIATNPTIVNTADTPANNKTATIDNAAEVETTADETSGTSSEAEKSSDESGCNPGATAGADDTSDEEQKQSYNGNGFRFNVSSDGLVEVISEKRAGKSVTGATGDIITFDDKGYAKVKLEDAAHFSQIPGFSFK